MTEPRPSKHEVELALTVCKPGIRHGVKPGIVLAREVLALREELAAAKREVRELCRIVNRSGPP